MSGKKGELTTQQLVTMIILITSFIIVIFLLVRLNLQEISDKEICRNSIIMKDKTGISSAPLNCKINYLCISADNKCEKMPNSKIQEVKTKEEVYKILADETVDCWWMFGEGKINYAGKEMTPGKHCAICSQIFFDENIKEEIFPDGKIEKRDFHNYLATQEMKGKDKTYTEYYFGTKNPSDIYSGDFGSLDTGKIYWVMTGVNSEVDYSKWGTGAGIAVGAALAIFAPVALPVSGVAFATVKIYGILKTAGTVGGLGGAGGYFLGTIVGGESGDNFLFPTIVEANSKDYTSLNCTDIRSSS